MNPLGPPGFDLSVSGSPAHVQRLVDAISGVLEDFQREAPLRAIQTESGVRAIPHRLPVEIKISFHDLRHPLYEDSRFSLYEDSRFFLGEWKLRRDVRRAISV
jgi:hypothetical protein